jgi:hypothetical protein
MTEHHMHPQPHQAPADQSDDTPHDECGVFGVSTRHGEGVAQLAFFQLDQPAEHPYGSGKVGSKYQGQRGPTPSRSYLNFIRSSS